jgi:N6-L-threonylcarbamoyladenine synthase
MKILAIESSCDDTAAALLEVNGDTFTILSEKTASQIDIHKIYGGVVPEVAARAHAEKMLPVIEEVLGDTKPDFIAVTSSPGLLTALLVGVEAAKNLSYLWGIPLISINHIEGHICSALIPEKDQNEYKLNFEFPAMCLIVSGGHTELILMRDYGDYERLGKTADDAAGECFDKTAKILGLEYPGGPKISKFATTGNRRAINFPRPMIKEDNLNFSFAGLKTSALYWLRDNELAAMNVVPNVFPAGVFAQAPNAVTIEDFCASFEQAILDVLIVKTLKACKKYQAKTVILGGGVSANKALREQLKYEIQNFDSTLQFRSPDTKYAMDNAAMIAVAAISKIKKQDFTTWQNLSADPNWHIGE